VVDESEISWIVNSDMGPLLAAYPRLQQLRVRGGQELAFGDLRHDNLRTLIVETGGLSGEVLQQMAAARLPALTHLELWLGDADTAPTGAWRSWVPSPPRDAGPAQLGARRQGRRRRGGGADPRAHPGPGPVARDAGRCRADALLASPHVRRRACRAGEDVIAVDGDGAVRRRHFIDQPIGNI